MIIAEVKVSGTTCEATRLVPISKGLVGATISIEYTDSVWDGLQKTVVFRSAVVKDVLDAGSEVTIPAEVVSRAGVDLYMGVYGVDAANNVVIPTIWAELGVVNGAAAPSGDTSTDPSLPVWAQIQAAIGNLDDLDTEAKSSLVAAVNEALTKGGGEVAPETIEKIVEDYLNANPPQTGSDGVTPTIGENGNWYLGDTDTGKPSRGAAGAKGDEGDPGSDAAVTADNIKSALGYTPVKPSDAPTVPTSLKNPYPLTFHGAEDKEYDGSEAQTVKIPEVKWHLVADQTTEEEINEYLIDADDVSTEIHMLTAYAPLAIALLISIPMDETQSSTSGNHYIYPFAGEPDDASTCRVSRSFSSWKTKDVATANIFFDTKAAVLFMGGTMGTTSAYSNITVLDTRQVENYALDGMMVVFANSGDHFPAGTRFTVWVLGTKP